MWCLFVQQYDDNDDDCSGDEIETRIFSHNDTWDNGVYEFNCGGLDSYVIIEVCTGAADCGGGCTGGTTYSIPGICHYGGNGTTNVYRTTNCNGTNGAISWYRNSTYSNCTNNAEVWTTTSDDCGFLVKYMSHNLVPLSMFLHKLSYFSFDKKLRKKKKKKKQRKRVLLSRLMPGV